MANIHWRAVLVGLFLPLLYWTGAVVAISLFGYPGIVCITPAAWLLALPVGMRIGREADQAVESRSVLLSAAVGGAILGLVQALLLAVMLSIAPSLPGGAAAGGANALVDPWLVALAGAVLGIPAAAGLSVLAARTIKKRE